MFARGHVPAHDYHKLGLVKLTLPHVRVYGNAILAKTIFEMF